LILLLGRYHGGLAEEPTAANCHVNIEKLRALAQGIQGWHEVRDRTRFSYTQWEVLAAVAARVPVLVYTPDRESSDEDLRSLRRSTEKEERWLELRQEQFAAWVRGRFTEDHFKSRTDLLNRLRAGVRRMEARRWLWRGIALLVVAAAILLGSAISVLWLKQTQHRVRQEQEEAAARDARVYQQKLAVAAGGALAMLGQDSKGTSGALFEKALQELGFPANQVHKLSEAYGELERSVHNGLLSYGDFERQKIELRSGVCAQLNVLGGRSPPVHLNFGYELHRLLLVLRFWDRLVLQGDVQGTSQECLTSLKEHLRDIEIGEHQAAEVRALRSSDFADGVRRKVAIAVIEELLQQFDMEPRRSAAFSTGVPHT